MWFERMFFSVLQKKHNDASSEEEDFDAESTPDPDSSGDEVAYSVLCKSRLAIYITQ